MDVLLDRRHITEYGTPVVVIIPANAEARDWLESYITPSPSDWFENGLIYELDGAADILDAMRDEGYTVPRV